MIIDNDYLKNIWEALAQVYNAATGKLKIEGEFSATIDTISDAGIVELVDSADNSLVGQKTSANSLPVVIASDQTVPISGELSATIDTISDAGIVELVDSADNPLIGQKNKAGSLPVTFPSDADPVPVTGSFYQETQPVSISGTPGVTESNLTAAWDAVNGAIKTVIQTTVTIAGAVTNTVLTAVYNVTAGALQVLLLDGSGAELKGQKTKANSIPVTLPSDGDALAVTGTFYQETQPVSIANPVTTELTSLVNQTTDYIPVRQIETWTISGVISSITNTVTIAGAVTNSVLTAVFDGVDSLRVAVQNTVTVANSVLSDIHDAVNHRIKVNIENTSLAVTGTFYQETQPVSGTFYQETQPVSIAGTVNVKDSVGTLGLGGTKTVTTAGTEVQLTSSSIACEKVLICINSANTGNIYIGPTGVLSTNSVPWKKDEKVFVKATNCNQIYINSSVNGEGVSFQPVS